MTYDDCLARLQVEQGRLIPLKEELALARARASNGDGYLPPEDYARLERLVRERGALCQRIQAELARLKRTRPRPNTGPSLARRFMDVAKRTLMPELFEAMLDEAQTEVEEVTNMATVPYEDRAR